MNPSFSKDLSSDCLKLRETCTPVRLDSHTFEVTFVSSYVLRDTWNTFEIIPQQAKD